MRQEDDTSVSIDSVPSRTMAGTLRPDSQAETDPVAGLVESVKSIPRGRHMSEMVEMKTAVA